MSRTTRRPQPKHRAPTPRRGRRRVGGVAAATAVVAAAAGVTVHVMQGADPSHLPLVAAEGSLSHAVPGSASVVLTGALLEHRADRRASYAGAEARTVLEASRLTERSRAVSRSASRTPSSTQGRHARAGRTHHHRARRPAGGRHAAAPAPAPAWVLPVAGYRLTARFGECSALWGNCHTGLDFAAPTGTPLHAVAAGTITEVGWAGAYGNRTVETLADGTELWYCHQDSVLVGPGSPVAAGQEIGRVGSTGNTTGPHLHLEVRPGGEDPVDPFAVLTAHGLSP